MPEDVPLNDARARLAAHFSPHPPSAHPSHWDALWAKGDFLPWDRGQPNPALVDTLHDKRGLLGPPVEGGKRKRALVPGCGKGYDVLLLASFGYDAWGLEASPNAVKACEKLKQEVEQKDWEGYKVHIEDIGRGKTEFVHGDFFQDGWVEKTEGAQFDLIYDYTVGAFLT